MTSAIDLSESLEKPSGLDSEETRVDAFGESEEYKTEIIEATLYKCSMCSFLSTHRSRVTDHVQNRVHCKGAVIDIVDMKGVCRVRPPPEHRPVPKKRGPLGADTQRHFDSCIAWHDMDARQSYLLYNPELLGKLLEDSLQAPVKLFDALWGDAAPREFRSIIRDERWYYACECDGTSEKRLDMRAFEREVMGMILDMIEDMFLNCKETLSDEIIRHLDVAWGVYFTTDHTISLRNILTRKEPEYSSNKRTLIPSQVSYETVVVEPFKKAMDGMRVR